MSFARLVSLLWGMAWCNTLYAVIAFFVQPGLLPLFMFAINGAAAWTLGAAMRRIIP
jgi:hypothetical protein